jgi:hypothetical protein
LPMTLLIGHGIVWTTFISLLSARVSARGSPDCGVRLFQSRRRLHV